MLLTWPDGQNIGLFAIRKILPDRAGSHSIMDSNVLLFELTSWQADANCVTAAGKGRTSGDFVRRSDIIRASRRLSFALCNIIRPTGTYGKVHLQNSSLGRASSSVVGLTLCVRRQKNQENHQHQIS